jgi:hemerythrin-like domain-containing protein
MEMQTACNNNRRPAGQSIRQFIRTGLDFCSYLTTHHTIEEQFMFPQLAKKMPEFRRDDQLLRQHHDIHEGLSQLEEYLGNCQRGEADFRLGEVKRLMDAFGAVLWAHLDAEVRTLGAENMRQYWTLEEMRRLLI